MRTRIFGVFAVMALAAASVQAQPCACAPRDQAVADRAPAPGSDA